MSVERRTVETSELSTSSFVEEKTEPFSQTEIEARLRGFRAASTSQAAEDVESPGVTVPLDDLVVPPDHGFRLLMRPLSRSRSVSPSTTDNCQWLALRASIAAPASPLDCSPPGHRILAVAQTAKDTKFVVNMPPGVQRDEEPLRCELYYDPHSDNQILVNRSEVPIILTRLSQPRIINAPNEELELPIYPGYHKGLAPGTWRVKVNQTALLDFRILEKSPAFLRLRSESSELSDETSSQAYSESATTPGKRGSISGPVDILAPGKRQKVADDSTRHVEGDMDRSGAIAFLCPEDDPLVLPLPKNSTVNDKRDVVFPNDAQPLLAFKPNEAVKLQGPGETDSYELIKQRPIANSSLSSVFSATANSHPSIPSDGRVITVKVLKTRTPQTPNHTVTSAHQATAERNIIRQADIWLREYNAHQGLTHSSIVRLYAGDARYLSLYMEHVEAHDLASRHAWRNSAENFAGNRSDALRILRDIAGALAYVHSKGLVHNDIKPGNILYSRDRGAVLCDFGLSTPAEASNRTMAGTPYYIPPEYINNGLRGAPGDVWALGVTMLYALKRLVYPDSLQRPDRPKPLYWQIADVNKRPVGGSHVTIAASTHPAKGGTGGRPHGDTSSKPSAITQMQQWLVEVTEARKSLNVHEDRMDYLVSKMLTPHPKDRITMDRIVKEFMQANQVKPQPKS